MTSILQFHIYIYIVKKGLFKVYSFVHMSVIKAVYLSQIKQLVYFFHKNPLIYRYFCRNNKCTKLKHKFSKRSHAIWKDIFNETVRRRGSLIFGISQKRSSRRDVDFGNANQFLKSGGARDVDC